MIEFIGWAFIGIFGGYGLACAAFLLFSWGGLEGLARGQIAAMVALFAWVPLFIWFSPITIGVSP